MPEVTNPKDDLLKQLEQPGSKPKVKAPPMPKAVKERLDKATAAVKPSLVRSTDGKTEVLVGSEGDAKAVQETVDEHPEIEQSDRVALLAHILGAPHFQKNYTLFGGALALTLRTRTSVEDETCLKQASADIPDPLFDPQADPKEQLRLIQNTAMARLRRYQEYAMLYSIAAITMSGVTTRPDVTTDLKASYDSFLESVPQVTLGLIRMQFSKFEGLVNTMLSLADKPSFWEAASPG